VQSMGTLTLPLVHRRGACCDGFMWVGGVGGQPKHVTLDAGTPVGIEAIGSRKIRYDNVWRKRKVVRRAPTQTQVIGGADVICPS